MIAIKLIYEWKFSLFFKIFFQALTRVFDYYKGHASIFDYYKGNASITDDVFATLGLKIHGGKNFHNVWDI